MAEDRSSSSQCMYMYVDYEFLLGPKSQESLVIIECYLIQHNTARKSR